MGTLVEHRPPQKKIYNLDYTRHRVYLAGSTNGKDWQRHFVNQLSELRVDVFNPRTEVADGLYGWELDHLNIANIIAVYFEPGDPSPNGLITLGMFAKTDRLIVCCQEDFYKKGDIDHLCEQENIHQVETLDLLIANTIARISPRSAATYQDLLTNIT